jgi:HK97 family phage portal protein
MTFWASLLGFGPNHEGVVPNSNPSASVGEGWNPGDPNGLVIEDPPAVEPRSLGALVASPWSGWPAEWSTPNWAGQMNKLVDTAWDAIDLNASVLSTMPVYRTRNGEVVDSLTWMKNPDEFVYQSWQEFAKQLFWDYQLGEAFVLAMSRAYGGYPNRFRVIPPSMMHVEFGRDGLRHYFLGGPTGPEVTGDILHIRYQSASNSARGVGPLDGAGARMTTAGLLQRYVDALAENGGRVLEWITTEQKLSPGEAQEMQQDFIAAKRRNFAEPAVFGKGAKLEQAEAMNAKDMALLELSQWTESRICVKLGVPPFLMGLPSGGDSMTYSNVAQLFDFHDRASLGVKAASVMPALSNWLLPLGQQLELNRDEYSRAPLKERAEAYKIMIEAGVMVPDEARAMERLSGPAASTAMTGGDQS